MENVVNERDEHFFLGIPMPEKAVYYLKWISIITIGLLYHAWFIYAIYYNIVNGDPILWCHGLGFVIITTGLSYFCIALSLIIKHMLPRSFKAEVKVGYKKMTKALNLWYVEYPIYIVLTGGAVAFMVIDAGGDTQRLISMSGIFVLLGIGVLCSKNIKKIDWRVVFGGMAMQFIFALFILR